MRIPGITIILAILMTTPGAGQAQARKIFIPIPAASEKMMKDLPDIRALHRENGRHFYPGYKFDRYSGNERAGHADGSKIYHLSKDGLKILILLSVLKEMLSASGKPGGFSEAGNPGAGGAP